MFTDWGQKPGDGLEMLEDADWPEHVKKSIVESYAKHGKDITNKKLVEPTAYAFKAKDGAIDWDFVIDYFEWEAASLNDAKVAEKLQKKSMKKRGFMFTHGPVYSIPY